LYGLLKNPFFFGLIPADRIELISVLIVKAYVAVAVSQGVLAKGKGFLHAVEKIINLCFTNVALLM